MSVCLCVPMDLDNRLTDMFLLQLLIGPWRVYNYNVGGYYHPPKRNSPCKNYQNPNFFEKFFFLKLKFKMGEGHTPPPPKKKKSFRGLAAFKLIKLRNYITIIFFKQILFLSLKGPSGQRNLPPLFKNKFLNNFFFYFLILPNINTQNCL